MGLSGNTKDRNLIFVFPKPERVEWLEEDNRGGINLEKGGLFLVVWHYLSPRGKNFKLGMRLLHGRSSTVKQLKIWKENKELHGIIVQPEKRRKKVIDLYLRSFSFSCSLYLYLTTVFGNFRLRMSLRFIELNYNFIVVETIFFFY